MAKVIGKRRITVLGSHMSYIDTRAGEHLFLFLHGNPTSSYLWRNVIPRVQGLGRCLAPDLVGMGDSGKVAGSLYLIQDQVRYLDAWIKAIQLDENKRITLIGHEWGVALAFDWCRKNPGRVEAVIHMEGVIETFDSYADLGPSNVQNILMQIRDTNNTVEQEKILAKSYVDMCVDEMLVQKKLTTNNITLYKRPFLDITLPITTLVRQLPIRDEGPHDVMNWIKNNSDWMAKQRTIPVLHFIPEDGRFGGFNTKITESWRQVVLPIPGGHFVSEGAQAEIGTAIVEFIRNL